MKCKSLNQLPIINFNDIKDDDLLLFWDKSATPGEIAALIVDSSTKAMKVGDLKKYILAKAVE